MDQQGRRIITNTKHWHEKCTLVVDAQEQSDVATVDLAAQFLQTDMDEDIFKNWWFIDTIID